MPHTDIKQIVSEAVQETLASLGFDLKAIHETQADLLYLRRLRKWNQVYEEKIKLAIISVATPAVLYLLWIALKGVMAS